MMYGINTRNLRRATSRLLKTDGIKPGVKHENLKAKLNEVRLVTAFADQLQCNKYRWNPGLTQPLFHSLAAATTTAAAARRINGKPLKFQDCRMTDDCWSCPVPKARGGNLSVNKEKINYYCKSETMKVLCKS